MAKNKERTTKRGMNGVNRSVVTFESACGARKGKSKHKGIKDT
tara:strand:- start:444 stop:572 length:129 start_codon:yes stop_codon:yes gene_type:complete